MTYKETIEFLYRQLPVFHRIGKAAYKAGLDNTLALDSYFGHPHRKFRSVHIAGTNGKGSVSHMIASVLQEAGYRTGLYTSPHLKDYRERIRINGEMIPEEEVVNFVKDNLSVISELKPSFFEMSVAMAFDYFARNGVEYAVIETGLGGRLDSTNIIEPLLSIITNIGMDHMDLLGDTLAKIAVEKAGIIKKNTPVIVGESAAETEDVFISKASSLNSQLVFADKIFNCRLSDFNMLLPVRGYSIQSYTGDFSFTGSSGLTGDYQSKNIPVVWCAARELRKRMKISDDEISRGIERVIENTGLQGRWQVLSHKPLVLCDTGHNKDGLAYVLKQLNSIRTGKLHIVAGFVNDKDLSLVLPLFPADAIYYFTRADVPRSMDPDILRKMAEGYGLAGTVWPTVRLAINAARSSASENDVIFIGGSTFIVAEAL